MKMKKSKQIRHNLMGTLSADEQLISGHIPGLAELCEDYGDEEEGNLTPALVIPQVYKSKHAFEQGQDLWQWHNQSQADNFPLAHECKDSAWQQIEDAEELAPSTVPVKLVESWDTEKRSR